MKWIGVAVLAAVLGAGVVVANGWVMRRELERHRCAMECAPEADVMRRVACEAACENVYGW